MMRSMFTAVSGLRTHQTKMDVIGNNIANVNTVGFKSSSVTFKEIFSQTTQGATAPNEASGRGGVNPMQIGLGVSVASIDNIMTQGAAQVTDNPLDMMINGDAFFIVGDANGQYFTRAGAFRLDVDGNLVAPGGLKVMGWPAVDDPAKPGQQKIVPGRVEPIVINSGENLSAPPSATKNVQLEGNINTADGKDGIVKTMSFHDSLGNKYTYDVTMKFASNQWTLDVGTDLYRNGEKMTTPGDVLTTITSALEGVVLKFDAAGKLNIAGSTNLASDGSMTLPNTNLAFGDITATIEPIKFDFTGLTQYNQKTTAKVYDKDGYQAGVMNGFSVGEDGIVWGTYSNGAQKKLGQLAVASFKNPAGLEKKGSNLFAATANSGYFDGRGEEPQANGGSIGAGRLEMSNVDLSQQFTEMITTQRGFQANSRIIGVSDEMLQELVNLKR